VARWLLAVASIVLVIATANVANMMLARSVRRRREIAVRLALGVSLGRLARSLIAESLVLAVAGGLLGLALAYGGGEIMRRVLLPDIVWATPPVDLRVLGVAVVLTMAIGVGLGVAPAIQARRTDVNRALRSGSRESGVKRNRLRTGLLVVQAALSVALLAAAGLFVRSLRNVRDVDLGIQPERVMVATVAWPVPGVAASVAPGQPQVSPRAIRAAQWRDLRDRIAALPDVETASLAVGSPFGFNFGVDLKIPGRDSLPQLGAGTFISAVGRDYFATVGTRLVRGRLFNATEGAATERVAIVNETMARALWPNEQPLGKCLVIGDAEARCSTVVGVVRDAHQFAIREEPSMQYYVPIGQESGFGGTVLMVRPKIGSTFSAERLRRAIGGMVPNAQLIRVEGLQTRIDPQIRPWKLGAALFGLFGALAVLVAAIGLYSVITYLVAQRNHEFGVRTALGARSSDLLRQVVGEGVRVTVPGIAIGLLIALAAGKWIAPLLFNVSPRDPLVFASVAVVLLAVAAVASLAPAAKAARVDPMAALREE
jgi:predicted permease